MGGITVTGGYDGIEANVEELTSLAACCARASDEVWGAATRAGALVRDGPFDWTGSGLAPGLGPGPAPDVQALTTAITAAGYEGRAAAATAHELADTVGHAARRYAGADAGMDFGALLAPVGALGDAAAAAAELPFFAGGALGTLSLAPLSQWAASNEDALASGADALRHEPAVRLGLEGVRRSGQGTATIEDRGPDLACDTPPPPRSVTDLLTALQRRNQGTDGEIDVRFLECTDGQRRVIVDIPGTKSWLPWGRSPVNLTSNLDELDGHASDYQDGVLAAMTAAGVRPTDEVMLVGHSLGGMVAVTTARDVAKSKQFTITQVVTAGAPVGGYVKDVPTSVNVLALENKKDLVPDLDGRGNPDRPNVVTVRGRTGDGTVGGNHGIDTAYEPIAAQIDYSCDRSIDAYRDSVKGFFSGTAVTSHVYVVSRC